MTVQVTFTGGPLHGQKGNAANLPQTQLFFSERDKQVHFYRRVDELRYDFDPDTSKALTDRFDEAFARFGAGGTSIVGWGKNDTRV